MSDVTKRMAIRLLGLLVAVSVAVTLGLTVLRPDPPATAAPRPSLASRVPGAVLPVAAADVLPVAAADSPVPSRPALSAILRSVIADQRLGPAVSVDILDPLTGTHLLTSGDLTPRTPASTAKLLTAAAALSLLGPQTTLPTTVLAGRSAGELVLQGGGDVLLGKGVSNPDVVDGRAGLTTLARQTAAALHQEGTTTVRLLLDDRLFVGPAVASTWSATDVADGFVAPIYPLEIDAGRLGAAEYAPRSSDPAMSVARLFAQLLGKSGITVTGSPQRGTAPEQAAVIGQVQSAPISGQVEYALTESDNTVAEALGRLVAVRSDLPGRFTQVGPAVLGQVDKLGVPVVGAVMVDGSGLSAGDAVPVRTMTSLLALATSDDQPQLRALLSGLPIAAVSGTLVNRFTTAKGRPASGVVRAKTGTLTGVSSLAGTLVDADGRLLVFAAMADQVTSTSQARAALDELAEKLAACGCR